MLKIRLRRMGKTHAPFYRVVVSDSRRTPTAASVEEVGHYNPRPTPPDVKLDLERLRYWQGQGALLSPTVKKLVHRVESGKLETEVPKAEKKKAKAAAAAAPAEKPAEEKVEATPAAEPAVEAQAEAAEAAPAEEPAEEAKAETEAPAEEAAAPEQKTEAAPAEEPAEPAAEEAAAKEEKTDA